MALSIAPRRSVAARGVASLSKATASEVLRRVGEAATADAHPLAPAAVRIERSRLRQEGARADQTALTVWFGSGPSLPAPSLNSGATRLLGRALAAAVGAAALGAMAVIANQREAERTAVRRLR